MRIISKFPTDNFHGYNVKYSFLCTDLLACATSENYGIAGRGRLYIINLQNPEVPKIVSVFDWSETLYDVTWSEVNEKIAITSCGDGSILIWDYLIPQRPVAFYKIHQQEVYSVEWNPRNAYPLILSASWDNTIKLWDPFAAKEFGSFLSHTDQVNEAKFSPHCSTAFSSVSADSTLKLWDLRHPEKPNGTYPHGSEILCCDWAKTDEDILAVGTADCKIVGWDIRNMKNPAFVLVGHEYAIRRLKFAPNERGKIVSVSYDFTTRLWDWSRPQADEIQNSHTEFVYGLDFNPAKPFEVSDCAWDSLINIYDGQTAQL